LKELELSNWVRVWVKHHFEDFHHVTVLKWCSLIAVRMSSQSSSVSPSLPQPGPWFST